MMKTILKYLAVVGLLAHGAFAAGTWVKYETAAPYTGYADAIRDCEVDSKGTLWYLVGMTGLYSQTPDNQPYKSYTLPANMLGERMGLYMNTKNDSLWIGGRNGIVYAGKNGVFSAKPTIPLIYNHRFLAIVGTYWDLTHVNDFIVDSNGRFIASTDSLAWWLNGNKWDTLGNLTDYPDYTSRLNDIYPEDAGFGFKLGQRPILDGNGVVWFYNGTRISKSYEFLAFPQPRLSISGGTSGPDGDIYSHDGRNLILRYNLPNYEIDTIFLRQDTQSLTELWTSAIWQDENGWIWVGQTHGMIKLVKDDQVKYAWDFGYETYPFVQFKRSPTGDFWACTNKYLYRYSESYSIPPEATNATIKPQLGDSFEQGIRIGVESHSLSLVPEYGKVYHVRVIALDGRAKWSGIVSNAKSIELQSGMWIVESKHADTPRILKTIVIP